MAVLTGDFPSALNLFLSGKVLAPDVGVSGARREESCCVGWRMVFHAEALPAL